MKNPGQEKLREHYQLLRKLGGATLWSREVPRFNSATSRERMQLVSVVRAVGVVFSESGSREEKERARVWLTSLLEDPEEKIRRYAMVALTKLGGGESGEAKLLEILENPASSREDRFVAQTLERGIDTEVAGKHREEARRRFARIRATLGEPCAGAGEFGMPQRPRTLRARRTRTVRGIGRSVSGAAQRRWTD